MAPSPLYPYSTPLLKLQTRSRVHGNNATVNRSSSASTGSEFSSGLSATAAIGGFLLVVVVFCFLWYDHASIHNLNAKSKWRTMFRLIGVCTCRKKSDSGEDQHKRRAFESFPKPISREAWQSKLQDSDSPIPQCVITQDSWFV